jgi:aspartate-semialdehyde dehydrogenase
MLCLPSAPARPIIVRDEPDRPQTRFDRDAEKGMASVVGRLRPCSILDWKFVTLGHNTIRGAAGGAILNAELLVAKGLWDRS